MSRIKLSHKLALIKRCQTQILLVAALATLGACAPLAQVREVNPRLGAQHGTLPQLQRAERAIADAEKLNVPIQKKRLALIYVALNQQRANCGNNPKDLVALRDYDFALSRVFSVIRDAHLDPWTHPLHVPAPNGGEYVAHPTSNLRTGSGDHRISI